MKMEIVLIPLVALLGWLVYPRKAATSSTPGRVFYSPSVTPNPAPVVTYTPAESVPGDNQSIINAVRAYSVENATNNNLDLLFQKHGGAFGIPWQLLKAVAMRESSLNPLALNEENDGEGGQASRGLMQILTPNRLNIIGWSGAYPLGGVNTLFDPDKNIYYGAQILKWNMETYGLYRGIAIYNNWSQRNEPANGPFSNQYYVDGIINYFKQYGGDVDAAYRKYGNGSKG
ncbi:MAG: lytic transglycosylase domain-containing protein [Rhodospirillaceae bacterium]|nr:lytic transglycosylase domain-containing protein [Rhodospirillaceae bacterium]